MYLPRILNVGMINKARDGLIRKRNDNSDTHYTLFDFVWLTEPLRDERRLFLVVVVVVAWWWSKLRALVGAYYYYQLSIQ